MCRTYTWKVEETVRIVNNFFPFEVWRKARAHITGKIAFFGKTVQRTWTVIKNTKRNSDRVENENRKVKRTINWTKVEMANDHVFQTV